MEKQENAMGVKPIFPLLMSMAIPPMISMLIQSMYNIVDSIFVARLGEEALTAVSLAYPLQNLVLAVAVGIGVGVNAGIAKNLGAGDQEEVNKTAAHGLALTALHALSFVLIGLFLTKPFLGLFTDNEQIFQWGCDYSYVVICFSFGSLFHIYIEKMFQATGNMLMPMIMQGVGALINIILDPIMIFGMFGCPAMGVTGAAVATIIGQISACGLSIFLFCRNSGGIHINMKGFRFEGRIVKQIYNVAVPSGLMMSLPSILIGVLNGILAGISQTGVAVLGIYFKLQTFVYMPANGLIQGMRPIVSYNYGAGMKERLVKTIRVSFLVTGVIMAAGTLLFFGAPEMILNLFEADASMMEMGKEALRMISLGFLVSTVGVVLSGVFEALGKGGESLAVSLLRQLVLIIPLSLLLVNPLGTNGVWVTFPISELAAALVGIWIFLRVWKKL